MKAVDFEDYESLNKILKESNPKKVKELGRNVKNFNQDIWLKSAYYHMRNANYLKYTQNHKLLKKLLSTGDKIIVEAAYYDPIWGVGLHEQDPLILDEKNWKGTNWLGKVLMEVRELYRGTNI